jgi:SAM-dependent methyltransferase
MHQKLHAVANDLWGIDINAEGIEFLKGKGFTNLFVSDASELHLVKEWQDVTFDVIVTSEVVEHLLNPGLFLQSVKQLMKPGHTELIITVPNAFRIDTLIWLLRGIEFNHPDHNYWFSYLTITNLVRKNGLVIRDLYVYSFQSRLSGWKRIKDYRGQNNESQPSTGKQTGISQRSIWHLIFSYFKSIPKRALVSYLYKKSPFWGDGLIVVSGLETNA